MYMDVLIRKRGGQTKGNEQRTENPRVGGSIPPLATNFCRLKNLS